MKKPIGIFLAAFICVAAPVEAATQNVVASTPAASITNSVCATAHQAYKTSCQKGDRCSDQCTQARAAMAQCMRPNNQNKAPPKLSECNTRKYPAMPKDAKVKQPAAPQKNQAKPPAQ